MRLDGEIETSLHRVKQKEAGKMLASFCGRQTPLERALKKRGSWSYIQVRKN